MRYFVRIRDNPKADNSLQPLSLHRLGKRGEILITERWERHSKQWVDNLSMLYRFSGMGGADDFREIVEPEATALIKQWSDLPKHSRDKGISTWEDRRATEFQEAKESIQDIEHHVTGPSSIGPRPSLIRGSVVGPLRRVIELQPLYINVPIDDSEIEEHKKHVLALFETGLEMEPVESAKSHMTLLMSDNCPDQVINEVINELSLPMAFSVEISHLEVLESEDGFTLVWVVNPDPALIRLQSELFNALKRRNIDISEYSDPKSYKPHISLAYNLSHKPDELPSIEPFKISVDGFVVTRKNYREIMSIELDVVRSLFLPTAKKDLPDVSPLRRIVQERDYPDPHCGLPGEIGGSAPRDECAVAPSTEMLEAEYADLNMRLWDPFTPPDEKDIIKARMAEIDEIIRPVEAQASVLRDEPESDAFASPPTKVKSANRAEAKAAKKERRKKSKKKRKRKAKK